MKALIATALAISQFCLHLPVFAGSAVTENSPLTTVKDEIKTDKEALARQTQAYLAVRDYAALDKLADTLRNSKAQYPNGWWRIDAFYPRVTSDENNISDAELLSLLDQVRAWIKSRPNSVTARVYFASLAVRYAWNSRGVGWASSVSDEGWAAMSQREAAAARTLKDTRALKQTCPHWWYVALYIRKDQSASGSEMQRLLNEALTLHPGYNGARFAYEISRDPRWGGEPGELEQTASNWADKVGGVEGDKLYAQCLWEMDRLPWYREQNVINELHFKWDRAKKGFTALKAQYPKSLAVQSEFCRLSCLANDFQGARALFTSLKGRVDDPVWKGNENFVYWRDRAFASKI